MDKCWCGNNKLKVYSKHYNKCDKCGTLVCKESFSSEIYEVTEEKDSLYGSNYWQDVMLREAGVSSLDELIDMYIPERVSYWVKCIIKHTYFGKPTAEIGCGMGQLSYVLNFAGYDVTDFELSPEICEVLRTKLGLNVICGEIQSSKEKFSNIISIDVFEHLIDPEGFLDNCFERLEEGGVLVLQTPCYDPNLSYEKMLEVKSSFAHLLVPDQHVFLYSRDAIEKLLFKHGFKNIVFEPAYFGDDYDMFLFAFKNDIITHTPEEIDNYLNIVKTGRLIKAIIGIDDDRRRKDAEIAMFRTAAEERLVALNETTKIAKMLERKVKVSEMAYGNTINIGVNLISLYPGKIGGAEQYVRNVIDEMSKLDNVNLFVFVNDSAIDTFKNINVTFIKIDLGVETDDQLLFYIDYHNVDVMFCPLFFVSPINCPVPVVASILDVQHEFYPQYFEKKVLNEIRKNTSKTLERVDGIITISEYSKKTIIDKYNVPANKIVVTYLNSDSVFQNNLLDSEVSRIRSEIADDYIFYPANSWPHKNHINLLKAYLILKRKYNIKHKLVFTGDSKQKKEEINEFINKNGLAEDVVYLGYRKQEEMPYIFAGASILVFPSLFEGFGIPLVEAMRVGTAIACSSCGSIPEVAKDAALYFDAENPDDIAEKINRLLVDESLRNELVIKGEEVAKTFSWEKCAKDTVGYLRKISNKAMSVILNPEDRPLVTIVTPSYNQGEFIEETIESVLSQDYPNIEYIVVDGGSTDNTIEILKKYEGRIKWISEKDKGQGDAVNKGIRLAKGEIIGWLNSDDTYLEGAISKAVEYFMTHPKTDMVYGEAYYSEKDGTMSERYPTMFFGREKLAHNCFICQPSAFFKKSIAIDAGLIDIKYQCSMDYEFWMRLSKIGKISYIPDALATSRLYEENKTLSRRDEVFDECCEAVKKHFGYVPISWCEGFADYKSCGKRGIGFYASRMKYYIRYNYDNPSYFVCNFASTIPGGLRSRIRTFVKGDSNQNFLSKYEDGWVSKQYEQEFVVDKRYNKLTIVGEKKWPLWSKLVIDIAVNGNNAGLVTVKKNGPFRKTIEIPQYSQHDSTLSIRLTMNKTFIPARFSGGTDYRCLSFVLDDIILESEQ